MTGLRLATPADGPACAAIYAPVVEGTAISFELTPPGADEMSARITRILARTPWLACEHRGGLVGYAYASPFRDRPAYRWTVEVSAYVHAEHRRSGIARALYTSLFALLTLQGFRTAYAGITVPNPASIGFHESMGMTTVGVFHAAGFKLGAWHDVAFLERPLAPRVADPAEPVPWPDLPRDTRFEQAVQSGQSSLTLS